MIWRTFDVRFYNGHIKLLDCSLFFKQHSNANFVILLTFVVVVAFDTILTFIQVFNLPI
jgi:hypothetical protein